MAFNGSTRNTDFFVSRVSSRVDIARSTKWRLVLPGGITRYSSTESTFGDGGVNGETSDENWIDIKSATLPDPKIIVEKTYYFNMPEKHVVGAQIEGQGTFTFHARENMNLYTSLLAATQVEFNSGILAANDNTDIVQHKNNEMPYDYTSGGHPDSPGIKLGLGTRKIFNLNSFDNADSTDMTASAVRSFDSKGCIVTELFDWMHGYPILRIYYVNPKIISVKLTPDLEWSQQAKLMTCSCTFEYDRPVIYPAAKFNDGDYIKGERSATLGGLSA